LQLGEGAIRCPDRAFEKTTCGVLLIADEVKWLANKAWRSSPIGELRLQRRSQASP
jgi:hypothetical protein